MFIKYPPYTCIFMKLCCILLAHNARSFFRETGMDASAIRVGFVTYAKELHFYNVKVNPIIINTLLYDYNILF